MTRMLETVGRTSENYGTHSIRKGVATYVKHLIPILRLCLASLIHHSDFFRTKLPHHHILFSTHVFRSVGLLSNLRTRLMNDLVSWMSPTGIPPHIEMYRKQQQIQDAVQKLPSVLMVGIGNLLDEKGVRAGNITHELLKETIATLLRETGISTQQTPVTMPTTNIRHELYYWNNRYHMLPIEFEFPKADPLSAWMLWQFGNTTLGYPPYKTIDQIDLSDAIKKKTLSEWRVMMGHIVSKIETMTGAPLPTRMTEAQALNLFNLAATKLPIASTTDKNRKRSRTQLTLVTSLRLIRQSIHANNPMARTIPYKPRNKKRSKRN